MGKTKKYYGGDITDTKKPVQIEMYNRSMGSVDKADQCLEPYSYDRKSRAWFKKLGIHFFERMILNAFLLYRAKNPDYKGDY